MFEVQVKAYKDGSASFKEIVLCETSFVSFNEAEELALAKGFKDYGITQNETVDVVYSWIEPMGDSYYA